jgi:hypothetical protein
LLGRRLDNLARSGSRLRLHGRRRRLAWRLVRRVAVKADVVKTNFTILPIRLIMVAEINLNRLSTTALRVLHRGAIFLAGRDVLADGLVGHLVVELEVAVKLDGHLNLLHTEAILALGTIEGSWRVLADFVGNAFGVKRALGERVPFVKLVLAAPSTFEIKVAVSVEVTFRQITPAEAIYMIINTDQYCPRSSFIPFCLSLHSLLLYSGELNFPGLLFQVAETCWAASPERKRAREVLMMMKMI